MMLPINAIFQVILIYSWAQYEPLEKGDYTYPAWANALGWVIAMCAILPVFIVAIGQIVHKLFFVNRGLKWKQVLVETAFSSMHMG